jgi:hypothetical protein
MMAQMNMAPYCSTGLNVTQTTALLANTLTLFIGLMLIIDYSMEAEANRAGDDTYDNTDREVISSIIVVVNLAILAVPEIVSALQSDRFLSFLGGDDDNLDSGLEGPGLDTESNHVEPELLTVDVPLYDVHQVPSLSPSHNLSSAEDIASSCFVPESLMTLNLVCPVPNLESCEDKFAGNSNIPETGYSQPFISPQYSVGYGDNNETSFGQEAKNTSNSLDSAHVDTRLCFVNYPC